MGNIQPLELLSRSRRGPSSPKHTGSDNGLQKPEAPGGVDARVKEKGRVGPEGPPGFGDTRIQLGPCVPIEAHECPKNFKPLVGGDTL